MCRPLCKWSLGGCSAPTSGASIHMSLFHISWYLAFSSQGPACFISDLSWLSFQMSLKPCNSVRPSVFCLGICVPLTTGYKETFYKWPETFSGSLHLPISYLLTALNFSLFLFRASIQVCSNLQIFCLYRHPIHPYPPYRFAIAAASRYLAVLLTHHYWNLWHYLTQKCGG